MRRGLQPDDGARVFRSLAPPQSRSGEARKLKGSNPRQRRRPTFAEGAAGWVWLAALWHE